MNRQGKPQTAIVFRRRVKRQPRAAQGIRLCWDVVGVLMIALPGLPRLLKEQHGLQCQHIRANQRLQHINDARVKQKTFMDFERAMSHVQTFPDFTAFFNGAIRHTHAGNLQATIKNGLSVLNQFSLLANLTSP